MSNSRLSVEIEELDGISLIRTQGEIDLYTVPEFQRALQSAIDCKPRAVVVDLSNISYIDSAGLGALLIAYKALCKNGADIYVIAAPESIGVRRVLEITRLDTLIQVRDSVDEVMTELSLHKAA